MTLDKMNIKAITIICLFIAHISSFSQVFDGGINFGLSSSQVGGDNLAGFYKAGILVGVFANTRINQDFKLQIEMNYIQKGSKNPNINDVNHSNYGIPYISLSYFELPIIFQNTSSKVFKFEAGILGGILINGYYTDLNGKMNNEKNPFTEYDIGALIGLDYFISEKISVNSRLSNSIFPIGREDYNNSIQAYSSSKKGKYNTSIRFSIYYNI